MGAHHNNEDTEYSLTQILCNYTVYSVYVWLRTFSLFLRFTQTILCNTILFCSFILLVRFHGLDILQFVKHQPLVIRNMLSWTSEHISGWACVFSLLGLISLSGIARSSGECMFNFIWYCHTVFWSQYTNLHSQCQCLRIPVLLQAHQHLALFVFYFLTFICQITGDAEHLFLGLFTV